MAQLRRRGLTGLAVVVVMVVVAGCGGGGDDDDASDEATITVFAAASLSDAMADLASTYEEEDAATSVQLSYGPSSGLREQILSGAPADVYASADVADMEALVEAGEIDRFQLLARNRMQIAVSAGNPENVVGLEDLARSELFVGLCAEEVPCGSYARQVLSAAGVEPSIDTEAADVRALLTQIESGDLDAGLVYVTDVLAAGDAVDGVDLPADVNVSVDYVIGTVARSDAPDDAAGFVSFVRSDQGQAILASHGFGTP